MNFIKTSVDPWVCIPALVYIETLKLTGAAPNKVAMGRVATVNGYQPLNIRPFDVDTIYTTPLKQAIDAKLAELQIPGRIFRSHFVSYDRGGYQKPHDHSVKSPENNFQPASLTGIVCLLAGQGGHLVFEDQEIVMTQGDMYVWDSNLVHWTTPCESPKAIVAFDIS